MSRLLNAYCMGKSKASSCCATRNEFPAVYCVGTIVQLPAMTTLICSLMEEHTHTWACISMVIRIVRWTLWLSKKLSIRVGKMLFLNTFLLIYLVISRKSSTFAPSLIHISYGKQNHSRRNAINRQENVR